MSENSQNSFRWKGKFVKEKVHNAMQQRVINGKNRCKDKIDVPNSNVKGNRIVSLEYMARQMQCVHCQKPLLLQHIEGEIRHGLASIFSVRCQKCQKITTIKSGEEYKSPSTGHQLFAINTKAALGEFLFEFEK